ncbi:AsmA-like C-terminal region-containing protein [Limibacter armeniacum]|uniref:AsmA-like C-terminal region-containing protein n=1 Tax=Limibacter armeniacum TaxID=466084 RepID=UPI002FE64FCF
MKKVLLTVGVLLSLVLLAAVAVPFIFKDDIAAIIQKEIDKNIDAKVHFSPDKLSLSLFRSFPDLSADVEDFAISGKGDFEGDTLLFVKHFAFSMDIGSVISGDKITINEVGLYEPYVNVKVTKEGKANYDIVKASEDAAPTKEETSGEGPAITINRWEIKDGKLIYDDQSIPVRADIDGLNHEGSGDFAKNIFDMVTNTKIYKLGVNFDGVQYMNDAVVDADITMNMDLDNMKFTFKDNALKVNEFVTSAEGWLSMPEAGFDMDLRFFSPDNTFKSLLSIVPGMYQQDFKDLKSEGEVKFEAKLKGMYTEEKMPAFNLVLQVNNGMFQYPDLPSAVEQVHVDMLVANPDGVPENTLVDVKDFSLKMADNPIRGKLRFLELDAYDLKLNGKLDLDAVEKIYPMDSTEMSGVISADIAVTGRVSDEQNKMLKANGKMDIEKFSFKSNDLPQGVTIASANMTLSPESVTLANYQGTLGKSDMDLKGKLSNYMGYALRDETLKGGLTLKSNVLDLNEWMSEEEETEETPTEEAPASEEVAVVEVPKNLDLTFDAEIKKVLFSDLPMDNMKGKLTVKDGIVRMDKLGFNTLGGKVVTSGSYNTQNPKDPKFDFNFDVVNVAFSEAYKNLSTVQSFAPIAKNINGDFSLGMSTNGKIKPDMTPDLATLFGDGKLKVQKAALQGVSSLNQISNLANIKELKDPKIEDVAAHFTIKDGKLKVDPFDFKMAGIKTNVGGSNSLDGNLDYTVKMDASNTSFAKYVSNMTFKVGGSYDKPEVKPVVNEEMKKEVEEKAKEAVNSLVKDAKDGKIDEKKVEEAKEEGKKLLNNLFKKK